MIKMPMAMRLVTVGLCILSMREASGWPLSPSEEAARERQAADFAVKDLEAFVAALDSSDGETLVRLTIQAQEQLQDVKTAVRFMDASLVTISAYLVDHVTLPSLSPEREPLQRLVDRVAQQLDSFLQDGRKEDAFYGLDAVSQWLDHRPLPEGHKNQKLWSNASALVTEARDQCRELTQVMADARSQLSKRSEEGMRESVSTASEAGLRQQVRNLAAKVAFAIYEARDRIKRATDGAFLAIRSAVYGFM